MGYRLLFCLITIHLGIDMHIFFFNINPVKIEINIQYKSYISRVKKSLVLEPGTS